MKKNMIFFIFFYIFQITHPFFWNIFRNSTGLALSSLLTVQNDSIYKRFDVILQSICEALNDIMKEDNDDPTVMIE